MDFKNLIRQYFMYGYATSDITLLTVCVCMFATVALSCYVYFVYKRVNRNAFYNRSFNLSLIVIAVITAAIILTIQSNIVVSLGMVGALSIVRFRTAVKEPMDLAFLFWSISVGIICGAGFGLIACVSSLVITVMILVFSKTSGAGGQTLMLVINADQYERYEEIVKTAGEYAYYFKVRSCSASRDGLHMAVEVKVRDRGALIGKVLSLDGVSNASLVEHDGNITV